MDGPKIIRIVVILALVGLICWALLHFVPMPYPFPALLVATAVILSILWVLRECALF